MQESIDDDLVQRLHADALAGAAGGSPHDFCGTGIVAVLAPLAGADGQTLAAARHSTDSDAGQENPAVGDAGRRLSRCRFGTERRDLLGIVGFDDAGARDPDPVLRLRNAPLIVGGLVGVGTAIMRPVQDAVDRGVVERLTPQRVAMILQPSRDGAGAHRLAAKAEAGELEDATHHDRLGFDHEQLLALLVAITVDGLGTVAERHGAAVPVPIECVLAAIAAGEQRSVVRVFLVHDGDDAAHHLGIGVMAEVLGHRDQLHAGFVELVLRGHLGQQPPRKARKIINDDHVHGPFGAGGGFDHLVELLAGEFAARDSDIFEDVNELDAFALGIGGDGVALAGDAGVVAILFIDADPRVAEGEDLRLLLSHI